MASSWLYLVVLTALSKFTFGSDLENAFSIKLFQQTYLREQRNFAISPPVLQATFGFLYQVSNRGVANELQRVMHLPVDRFQAAVELKASLVSAARGRQNFVNTCKLYRDQNELSEKFSSLFQGYFKPEVEFSSVNASNPVISVTPKDYRMRYYDLRLASEFRLEASWRNPFTHRKTENGIFKALNGYWMTGFMKQLAHFGVARLDRLMALEMHYSWKTELTMLLVMPSDEEGILSELVQRFDLDMYHAIDRSLRQRYMEVSIPKFSLEGNVSLAVPLARMGIVASFLHNAFDLYRYRGSGLGPVEQSGLIKVIEGGTGEVEEVAQRTLLAVPHSPAFYADRPFMVLVRNRATKQILAMGHNSYFQP